MISDYFQLNEILLYKLLINSIGNFINILEIFDYNCKYLS